MIPVGVKLMRRLETWVNGEVSVPPVSEFNGQKAMLGIGHCRGMIDTP